MHCLSHEGVGLKQPREHFVDNVLDVLSVSDTFDANANVELPICAKTGVFETSAGLPTTKSNTTTTTTATTATGDGDGDKAKATTTADDNDNNDKQARATFRRKPLLVRPPTPKDIVDRDHRPDALTTHIIVDDSTVDSTSDLTTTTTTVNNNND